MQTLCVFGEGWRGRSSVSNTSCHAGQLQFSLSLMGHICFLLKREQRGGKSSCWGVSFPWKIWDRQIQTLFSLLLLPATQFTQPSPSHRFCHRADLLAWIMGTHQLCSSTQRKEALCALKHSQGSSRTGMMGRRQVAGPNSAKLLYIQVTWEHFHWDEMFSRYLIRHALIKKTEQCSIL